MNDQLYADLVDYASRNPTILSISDSSIVSRLQQIYPGFFYKTAQLSKKKMAALFMLSHEGKAEPTCEICSGSVSDSFPWRKATASIDTLTPYGGWCRTCSTRCNQLLIEKDGTRKATFLEKFGADNPMKVPGFAKEAVSNRVTDWVAVGRNQRIAALHKNGVACELISKFRFDVGSGDFDAEVLIEEARRYEDLYSILPNRIQLSEWTSIPIQTLHELFFKSPSYSELYLSKHNESTGELEIRHFLLSIGITPDKSDRGMITAENGNFLEIDIPIHSQKLAIEYNGIIWHREGMGKTSQYHLRKTEECEKLGYQLLQIYDVEWNDPAKKEIWKSIIKAKLHLFDSKFYGRKCSIVQVTAPDARKFLDQNHLNGFVGASNHIGLMHDGELAMVLSYGKSRFDDTTEIIRMASKRNCIVVGGMSKLISYVKATTSNKITCYADRRYASSLGCAYGRVFVKAEPTSPNWDGFNLKEYVLRSRHHYMKHKLQNREGFTYDDSKSVIENMNSNGHDRIWNSGNLKFTT